MSGRSRGIARTRWRRGRGLVSRRNRPAFPRPTRAAAPSDWGRPDRSPRQCGSNACCSPPPHRLGQRCGVDAGCRKRRGHRRNRSRGITGGDDVGVGTELQGGPSGPPGRAAGGRTFGADSYRGSSLRKPPRSPHIRRRSAPSPFPAAFCPARPFPGPWRGARRPGPGPWPRAPALVPARRSTTIARGLLRNPSTPPPCTARRTTVRRDPQSAPSASAGDP